jgi:hypothetical protein
MKSLSISEKYGWAKYVGHQVYYSLVGRDYEYEPMPLALDQNVGVVETFSPPLLKGDDQGLGDRHRRTRCIVLQVGEMPADASSNRSDCAADEIDISPLEPADF